eukprot:s1617_g5.t1
MKSSSADYATDAKADGNGASASGIYVKNGPLALCSSTYFKSQFQVFYDSSKDFFLDRAEFGAQLAKMPYCCGSNCPHSTWCDGTLYPIFDFGSIETGASLNSRAEILSAATVFENVKQLGYAGMVPFCFREAQLMMPRNNTRTVEGWPDFVPKADDATAPVVVTFASCVRHTDCKTGYCDSTTSTCAPDPSETWHGFNTWVVVKVRVVFSIVTGSWGGCDKPCGGGQQIRDRDLRSNWIDITVTGTLPTNATAFEIRLGSSSGAMLDTYVVEVLQSECVDAGYCTIQASSQLPAYVDRLMLMGKNSDGLGPAVAEVFTDRVGETGSQQLFTVQSEAGMVHFHLAGASSTSGSWAPADRLPGIRMHLPDARRLMRTAGARFGDPQSSDHGVVVIDTVAVPGIPATRWIYATRPVFLSMDPALMTFLSAGLLKPEILGFGVPRCNPFFLKEPL